MAKKTTKSKTNVKNVTETLHDALEVNWTAEPKEHLADELNAVGGLVAKGTDDNGKIKYRAICNGHEGIITGSFAGSIKSAMSNAGLAHEGYQIPGKWTDVAPKRNVPKDPESLDELNPTEKKLFQNGYAAIEKAAEAEEKASVSKLEKAFAYGDAVRKVRDGMNSYQWRIFKKLAPNAHTKELLGKNSVGEAYRTARLRDVEGFDVNECLPPRVSGNKGVVSAYQTVINAVAGNIARIVRNDEVCKKLGVTGETTSERVRSIVTMMVDDGQYAYTEAGSGQKELEGPLAKLCAVVMPRHEANIPENAELFAFDGGKVTVAKVDVESDGRTVKAAVAGTVFGLEGDDELLAAIARAFGSLESSEAAADIASATSKLVSQAKKTKMPFKDWDVDTAARHLAAILFSRWDADNVEASKADYDAIIGKLDSIAEELEQGEELANILNGGEAPEDAEDGQDAADAAMSE